MEYEYYDDEIPGGSEAEATWEEYEYEDDQGNTYSAAEAEALIASGEFVETSRGPITPDTPLNEYGTTGRQFWSDNQMERSQQRLDYMRRRLNGEFG